MTVTVCKGAFAEEINNIEPWPECKKLENGNTMAEQRAGRIVGVAYYEAEKHCHGGKRFGSTGGF